MNSNINEITVMSMIIIMIIKSNTVELFMLKEVIFVL